MANLGGMQRVSLKLHDALSAHDASQASLDYDAVLLRSTWRWVHVKTPFFLVRAAARLIRKARCGELDVVLFSSMVTALLSVPLQGVFRRHGVRTAAIVHGLDVTTPFAPYQWLVGKVLNALDAILPVSRATARACLERGAARSQLHVIPNGIDPDRFAAPDLRTENRTALASHFDTPPSADALLLCSVGRQVKRKGTAWFVDHVMPMLPSDVHYWIAGDGPQDDAIQAAIDRQNLADRVRRLGRISNEALAYLYRGADLFVMPNVPVDDDLEGFGIVMLEAGQCGTPAVAARLGGIQDVITEGVNGHLVEPQSARAFADTILQYRQAPTALHDLARRTIAHTTSTFDWTSVADLYATALHTLHETGRPPSPFVAAPMQSSTPSAA